MSEEEAALLSCMLGALAGDRERLMDALSVYEGDELRDLIPRERTGRHRYRTEEEEHDTTAPRTPLQERVAAALNDTHGSARHAAQIAACSLTTAARVKRRLVNQGAAW